MKNKGFINLDDFRIVFKILKRYWYLPLLFGIAAFFIAYFLVEYRVKNVYNAKAQLLLKVIDEYRQGSVISDEAGFNKYSQKTYIDNANEMRIIKSYDLIEKVLNKVNFDVSYYIEGRVRKNPVFSGLPFEVAVDNIGNKYYEKEFSFKILSDNEYQLEVPGNSDKDLETVKGKFSENLITTDMNLVVKKRFEINPETKLNFPIYKFVVHKKESLVYTYLNSLKVENPGYTNVLEMSVKDELPEKAEMFLDTLASEYIKNSLEQRFEINEKTLVYIDKQMADVVTQLNSLDDTMQLFKKEKDIFNLGKEEAKLYAKMYSNEENVVNFENKLKYLLELENYVINDKDPEFMPTSIVLSELDEKLNKMVSQLHEIQVSIFDNLKNVTASNRDIILAKNKINEIKKSILLYISNIRTDINKKIAQLKKEVSEAENMLRVIPVISKELTNIERKKNINESMYLFLLQKKSSNLIARAAIVPNIKVIESPKSREVKVPDPKSIYSYAFIIAGIVMVVIVGIHFFLTDKIEDLAELKSKTSLPILGGVMFEKGIEKLEVLVDSLPKSPVTESFRAIRTNLQYFASDKASKIVMLTSGGPGDGKTFCSINLATILARSDKKVLLIELDLHKPKVQIGMKVDALHKGITTALIGNHSLQDAIVESKIQNLSLLLSGPIPPNPSEIIHSVQLEQFILGLKDSFDYIIIDTPPVGIITDALHISKWCDISLYVINANRPNNNSLTFVEELVETNKLNNFALIMNRLKKKSKSKYSYYNYGYGYGYGYSSGSYGSYN